MIGSPNVRIALVAAFVTTADQLAKLAVLRFLGYAQEKVIVPGFFKFVYWANTGAAWSLFYGRNNLLAAISFLALVLLFLARQHFEIDKLLGQLALGLMFGGILGNLIDRVYIHRHHVIDFLYFYTYSRSGAEIGFPAFNLADTAICTGVGLLFLLSWKHGHPSRPGERTAP